MKSARRTISIAAVLLALILGASSAWAGTIRYSYSDTVGPFSGWGTTGTQTKTGTGTAGDLHSNTVGGSYTLSARMQLSASKYGTWTGYVVSDDTDHLLFNEINSGTLNVFTVLQNRPQTTVSVYTEGNWRSN